MTISFVKQTQAATSGTSLTVTPASSGASGNLHVASIGIRSATVTVSSVTDTGGNTWTRVPNGLAQAAGIVATTEVWATVATASYTSITVTISGSINISTDLSEWSSTVGFAAVSSASGTAATETPATTTPTGVTQSPTSQPALVIGHLTLEGTTTSPTLQTGSGGTSGFTSLNFGSGGSGGNSFVQARAYRIITATGTAYGPTWTTVSGECSKQTTAFYESSGAFTGSGTESQTASIAASGKTSSAPTRTASATLAATGHALVPRSYYNGINVSGAQFHVGGATSAATSTFSNANPGTIDSSYHYEGQGSLDFLASRGFVRVKLPIRWERIQPTWGAALNSTEVGYINGFLDRAALAGLSVIIDIHNYGIYYQDVAGTGTRKSLGVDITDSQFADLWTRMSNAFAGHSAVHGFAIMNEPQPSGGLTRAQWQSASQAAVTAIRAVTSTTYIYVAGYDWQGTGGWTTSNGSTPWITDATGRYFYECHTYFDGGSGGNYPQGYSYYVTEASGQGFSAGANADALHTRELTNLAVFTSWLSTNGVPGVIGEIGWPYGTDATSWNALGEVIYDQLDSLGIPVIYWATGEFYAVGQDSKQAYEASSGTGFGPLDTAKAQATVLESHPGALSSLTASATQAVTATIASAGVLGLSKSATLSANATLATSGSTTYSKTASQTVTAAVAAIGSAASGPTETTAATLTASGVLGRFASAAESVTASISAAGAGTNGPTETIAAALTAAGVVATSASAAASETVTISATGSTSGTASRTVTATLAATGLASAPGSSTLTATAALTAAGVLGLSASAALTETATVTAAGTGQSGASATATASGTASGVVATSATATVSASVTITASGTVALTATASLTATATLTASGTVALTAARDITLTATLAAPTWSATLGDREWSASIQPAAWEADLA